MTNQRQRVERLSTQTSCFGLNFCFVLSPSLVVSGTISPLRLAASFGASAFLMPGCSVVLDPTTFSVETSMGGGAGASGEDVVELPVCVSVEESLVLCEHALSRPAAAYECELRGGYLVEIESAEENERVAQLAGETVGTNVWLGGTRTESFVWSWEHSGAVFWSGERDGSPEGTAFVNWAPDEPNNNSTVLDEAEKCLVLTLGGADWNDRACSLELPFACELN